MRPRRNDERRTSTRIRAHARISSDELQRTDPEWVKEVGEVLERFQAKYKNCSFCGRFVDKNGRCPKVFYDDYAGAWEHG